MTPSNKKISGQCKFPISKKDFWSTKITKINPIDKEAAIGLSSKVTVSKLPRRLQISPFMETGRINQLLKQALSAEIELREAIKQEAEKNMNSEARFLCRSQLRQYEGGKKYKALLKKKVSEYKRDHQEELAKTIEIEEHKRKDELVLKRKNIYKEIVDLLMMKKNNLTAFERSLMLFTRHVENNLDILPDDFCTLIKHIIGMLSEGETPRGLSFAFINKLRDLSLRLNSSREKSMR